MMKYVEKQEFLWILYPNHTKKTYLVKPGLTVWKS